MNILIDNSTYYSVKVAIQESIIDPHVIYNMANFLESLVLANEIYFAPTQYWRPDSTDRILFKPKGPCVQITKVGENEVTISTIWQSAIAEAIKDLVRPLIVNSAPSMGIDLQKAYKLIKSWEGPAATDPNAFVETYSGLVYLTDIGTSRFFKETFGEFMRSIPTHEKLAYFLLRTNVAMELSDGNAYQPHSHRAPLVFDKVTEGARASKYLALGLVRDTEGEIRRKIASLSKDAILSRYGVFSLEESDIPLVLAVVLSGAEEPKDIIPLALKLRKQRAAKRYRKWATEVADAFEAGDLKRNVEAARELGAARQLLSAELNNLLDMQKKKHVEGLTKLMSYVDPQALQSVLASEDKKGVLMKAGEMMAKQVPEAIGMMRKVRIRRKVALLRNLCRKASELDKLNSLLEKVFGRRLGSWEIAILKTLRAERDKLIGSLGRIA